MRGSTDLHRRAGVYRDAPDDAGTGEGLENAMRVPRRLQMKSNDPGAGVHVRLDLVERLLDHQMAVLYEAFRDGLHNRGADRELWAKNTVHHVDVDDRRARSLENSQLIAQPKQVRRQQPDAELWATFEQLLRCGVHDYFNSGLSAISRYTWIASSGFMSSCTTLLTAWIMAAGHSDWKMLRPISTPAAPSWTAR